LGRFKGANGFHGHQPNMGTGCYICMLRALSCTLVHDCCLSVCVFFCVFLFVIAVATAASSASVYVLACTLGTAKVALVLLADHVPSRLYWLCQRGCRCLCRFWRCGHRRCVHCRRGRRLVFPRRSPAVLPVAIPTTVLIENCCGEPKYSLGIATIR
jgi:hypothetical protein